MCPHCESISDCNDRRLHPPHDPYRYYITGEGIFSVKIKLQGRKKAQETCFMHSAISGCTAELQCHLQRPLIRGGLTCCKSPPSNRARINIQPLKFQHWNCTLQEAINFNQRTSCGVATGAESSGLQIPHEPDVKLDYIQTATSISYSII